MNQDESMTCLELSRNKFAEGDFEGALRLAVKAQRMLESSETTEWLEKVKQAKDNATEDSSTNLRQRHSIPVKEEDVPKPTKQTTAASNDCNYTKEQTKEIKEFMKRNKEDYYAVLGVEKSATSDEIKKAYKKLALKFHPDKNQAPGADEAFKMISVAVSVLGDEEKRRSFDRFGVGNGNSMGHSGGGGGFASPFGAHFGHAGGFEGEISPEELFNMFFNSAFAQPHQQQGAHSFGAGPGQFFFSSNFHGHQRQFHRREARRSSPNGNENEELLKRFVQFIPLIIVFFLSIVSSWLFPGDSNATKYSDTEHLFSLNPSGKYRHSRTTRLKNVPYYATEMYQKYFSNLKADDNSSKLARDLASYEVIIENKLIGDLRKVCEQEQRQLANLLKRAKKDQWDEIVNGFKLKSCEKLKLFE